MSVLNRIMKRPFDISKFRLCFYFVFSNLQFNSIFPVLKNIVWKREIEQNVVRLFHVLFV